MAEEQVRALAAALGVSEESAAAFFSAKEKNESLEAAAVLVAALSGLVAGRDIVEKKTGELERAVSIFLFFLFFSFSLFVSRLGRRRKIPKK